MSTASSVDVRFRTIPCALYAIFLTLYYTKHCPLVLLHLILHWYSFLVLLLYVGLCLQCICTSGRGSVYRTCSVSGADFADTRSCIWQVPGKIPSLTLPFSVPHRTSGGKLALQHLCVLQSIFFISAGSGLCFFSLLYLLLASQLMCIAINHIGMTTIPSAFNVSSSFFPHCLAQEPAHLI